MKASNLRNILNPLDQQHLNAEYTTVPARTTTFGAATTTTTPAAAAAAAAAVAAAVASGNTLSTAAPRTLVGLNDGRPSTAASAATAITPSSSGSAFAAPPHRFPSREDRSISPRILPQGTQEWERQRLLPAINGLSTPHASPRVLPLPRDIAVQQQQQQQQQQQSPASSRSLSVTTPQARLPKQEFSQQQQQQQQLALPAGSSPWSSTGHGATPRRLLSPFGGDLTAQGTPSPFSSRAMSQPLDRQQPLALAATSTNASSTSSIGSSDSSNGTSNNAAAAAVVSALPSTTTTTTRGRPPLYSRGFWIRDQDGREPVISIPLGGGGGVVGSSSGGGGGGGGGGVVGAIECTVDLKQGSAAADAKRRRDARAAQRCRDRKRMHNLKTEQELARCQRRVAQLSHELDQLRRRNKLLLDMMPPGMREDAERAASPVTTLFPDD
ncbi:hypothetical protein PoMZ_12751 [Pyricularia oryzae]|uniref:BZIP domain-containing protein n=1 Tax=Pyricularia oryzae TaxID=318829 RepID=A0A4P7NTG6_PYROR|nr:hypothetical protein PoMZ_12751 [Pyricularia oryzae]